MFNDAPSLPSGISRRDFTALVIAAAASPTTFAQGVWPQRPVKFIVPNAAGSSVDTIGRVVANQMPALLKQAVVVDNKAGAAGAIGIEAGRTSAPDGYSLIIASSSSITVAPLLQKAVTYKPLADFDFVSLIALLPNVLVCTPGLPVKNTAELIAWAKSKGGKSNMASAGIGSASHLAGLAFQNAAGFESLHVPYKSGSAGVVSVVSGETDWVLTPAPAALGLVSSGRLRLLGHSMAQDAHPIPNAPSLADTVPGFEFSGWIGLMAPKGLPPQVTDTLRKALVTALQQPALRESFESNGAVPAAGSPQDFRTYLTRDIERTRKAIQAGNLQPE
ncbi:MAG: tripartite tricarboxylate transporter substrate binding protein [Pseudomonadota bacterium]